MRQFRRRLESDGHFARLLERQLIEVVVILGQRREPHKLPPGRARRDGQVELDGDDAVVPDPGKDFRRSMFLTQADFGGLQLERQRRVPEHQCVSGTAGDRQTRSALSRFQQPLNRGEIHFFRDVENPIDDDPAAKDHHRCHAPTLSGGG